MPQTPKTIRTRLLRHALSLPEAWQDEPWEGDVVAKVGKKIFAFPGATDHPTHSVSLKLPRSAQFALSLGCASPTGYGLGRHGWVSLDLGHPDRPATDDLEDWVTESYRAVAPKRLAALVTRPQPR